MNDWLGRRLAGAPAALRDAVVVQRAAFGARRDGEAAGVGAILRARAEALLAEARTGPPTPETAMTLLAADALLTLASEWVAEHDPGALEELR